MSEGTKESGIDFVNHPAHYTQGGVECIDAIAAATVNLTGIEAVCTANAIKYLWRWKSKNGLEDLRKARWYLDRLIQESAKELKAAEMLPRAEEARRKTTFERITDALDSSHVFMEEKNES